MNYVVASVVIVLSAWIASQSMRSEVGPALFVLGLGFGIVIGGLIA